MLIDPGLSQREALDAWSVPTVAAVGVCIVYPGACGVTEVPRSLNGRGHRELQCQVIFITRLVQSCILKS